MKVFYLAMIASLASIGPPVSANSSGELDGQAIICADAIYPIALIGGNYFHDGQVFYHQPHRDGQKAIIKQWKQANAYQVNPNTIEWRNADNLSVLNRNTLRLELFPMTGKSVWQAWQCEFMESLPAYERALEEARVGLQERINKRIAEGKS